MAVTAQCCIAGGGLAGIMLGYPMARVIGLGVQPERVEAPEAA